VINSPDRAEQADKRGCRADGSQHGESALHFGRTVVNRSSQAFGQPFGQADFRLQILCTRLMQAGGLQTVGGKGMKGIVVRSGFQNVQTFRKCGRFPESGHTF